ncbi:MAG: efflux RND transporter permease subunit [Spirochaetales bacterium]|nr:efflux RND transporter permease subunit [Spirochaetales bacterium]
MSIPRASVKHPVTASMVFVALFVLGVISLVRIGMELFPDIDLPTAYILTTNPGVGPYEIESGITERIEEAVAGLTGVQSINSTSQESASILTVSFASGTDMDLMVPEIREQLSSVEDQFPEGTERSRIFKFSSSQLPSLQINAYTRTHGIDVRALMDETVIPRLLRIPGVAQVQIFGGRELAVMAELNLDSLGKLNLPITQVIQAFSGENVSLPGGTIDLENRYLVLRTVGEFESVDDVGEVLVGVAGDVPIYLRDVADVVLKYREQEEFVRAGGYDGVLLQVQKQTGYNTVEVNEGVLGELEAIVSELPPSVQFDVVSDQAESIRNSIGGVTAAAWQGGLLAILVLLFFLRNARSTLIISTVIPVSVIATFSLIDFGGMTLNITSLLGITLAVGMFVDNAIVVLESIYRKALAGMPVEQAAVEGAEEVSRAITASTLTTMAVFVPMLFVEGMAGELFQDLSLTITFSLAISLASALSLIPVLTSRFLKVTPAKEVEGVAHHEVSLADVVVSTRFRLLNWLSRRIQMFLLRMDEVYGKVIAWALDHVWTIIGVGAAILVLSLGSVALLGMEFLPEADEGEFEISLETRMGSTYDYTTGKVIQVEEMLAELVGSDIRTMVSSVGDGGANRADIRVVLIAKDRRDRSIWQIVNEMDEQIAREVLDVQFEISILGMSSMAAMAGGGSSPIVINLAADDLDALDTYANSVVDAVASVDGTRNVRSSFATGKPELQFRVKRREAVSLGVSPMEIAATIRTAYSGTTVSLFSTNEGEFDVILVLRDEDRNDLSRISSLFFVTRGGASIPLENVVDVVEGRGPVSITRTDRTRTIQVLAALTGERALSRVMDDVEAAIDRDAPTPPGVDLAYSGSKSEMDDSFSSLLFALILAASLVYMVMASQFESFSYPLIVMFSIPFAVIGLVAALLFTGTTFNILSFVGMILLVGIVVNNAIVLIDYIMLLVSRGVPLKEAIIKGATTRLKPILMTSLTTILGLMPMALGAGEGSELRSPVGLAVVGGLTTSTLITLILIPTILWLVETKIKPALRRDRQPSEVES